MTAPAVQHVDVCLNVAKHVHTVLETCDLVETSQ